MDKLYLNGLSGCGKTSLGKWLATEKKLSFIDLDELIEEDHSLSVTTIFHDYGEDYFRTLEHQALKRVIASEAMIIALGGGTLANTKNQLLLKDELIIFIDRPIAHTLITLDTKNRPLLQKNPAVLYQLHKDRYDLYAQLATKHLLNDGDFTRIKEKFLNLDIIKKITIPLTQRI